MPSTNSDSVIWSVGDTVGRSGQGGTANVPQSQFVVSTATTAPTAAPTGLGLYLAGTDVYLWDSGAWVGPYSVAT